MEILGAILNFVLWLLAVYLLINCLYLGFFALVGLFPLKAATIVANRFRKIAVLFPTYQENVVILESVKAALAQKYAGEFKVVVIADGLEKQTVDTLKNLGAHVIEVFFEKSTKGKAMHFAMNAIAADGFEIAVVLDVDNQMSDDCLRYFNAAVDGGAKVVQAHRVAKNIDSSFAFLDACNEEVNNHLFRKSNAVLGLSPALIGSGMAFDFSYFRNLLNNIGETVGEDKQLDFLIAQDGVKIAYLDDVYVYDEKIENAKVFTKQRTRWIASQVEFLKKYALRGFVELFKGNFEFFNKSFQTMLVPRTLLLALLFLLVVQSFVITVGPSTIFWIALFAALCFILFISIPKKFYFDRRLYVAILHVPRAIFGMVVALFSIGKAKKSFMVTPHNSKPLDQEGV